MTTKGKKPQTQIHSMQTRSTTTSVATNDNESAESTQFTIESSTDNHNNVSHQTMTDPGPDPGNPFRETSKVRHGTLSENVVSGSTSSRSQKSPSSSATDSSTVSSSSRGTSRSCNVANKDVVSWILENYEERANSNVPRSGIYEHYKYYCILQKAKPVNAATFGKLIRIAFPAMSTRRLGNRGQSKYQYCNIQRREIPEVSPAIGAAIPGIVQATTTPSMPTTGSSQPRPTPHHQVLNTHTQVASSHSANNAETVEPTTFSRHQVPASASLLSHQQRMASGFNNDNDNVSNNDNGGTLMVDTRTQHDLHSYPPLQLPSPFGIMSSSSSPPLLPQHYLSNVELVSIFSSQPAIPHQQSVIASTTTIPLVSSSTSANYPNPSMAPLHGSETPGTTSVSRQLGDPQSTSIQTDQFARLYIQHCQDIYDAVRSGEFEKLQPIYDEFYQQMPSQYRSMVITTPELTDYIWRWDCNLYDSFLNDLLPKISTPISKDMANGLNKYTKNLPTYLQYLLADYPAKLRNKKFDVACVFVAKMRRHLALNQFAVKAGAILNQPIHLTELRRDWQTLDMGTILDQLLWICDCRNDDMAKILKMDVTQLLNTKSNLDKWMEWVDGLIEKFVPWFPKIHTTHEDDKLMKDAKQFVLKWRMYTSSVMQQLYINNVPTLESFKTLQFFFDDLILYQVEERIVSMYANTLQRPSSASATVL